MTTAVPESAAKRRQGSRITVPEDNVCARCGAPRRNVRKGWEPITIGGQVAGWTCPGRPTYAEPIRREVKADSSVRYLAAARDGGSSCGAGSARWTLPGRGLRRCRPDRPGRRRTPTRPSSPCGSSRTSG